MLRPAHALDHGRFRWRNGSHHRATVSPTQRAQSSQLAQVTPDGDLTHVKATAKLHDRGLSLVLNSFYYELLPFFLEQGSHITVDKLALFRNGGQAHYITIDHGSQYLRSNSDIF
jgi:hypothetical protein